MYFVEVILPLPIHQLFTYRISLAEKDFLNVGTRVAVPFGKNKMYTGLVFEIHQKTPVIPLKELKSIHQILDEKPIVNKNQLKLWEWIAKYYLCSLGEIYKAAVPSAFLLESEKIITKTENPVKTENLTDEEYLIYEVILQKNECSIAELSKIIPQKKVLATLKNMLQKKALILKEVLYEKYKPLEIKYLRLSHFYENKEKLNALLEKISRAKKQKEALLCYFSLRSQKKYPEKLVKYKTLQEKAKSSNAILKTMLEKGIFEIVLQKKDRIQIRSEKQKEINLSAAQNTAFQEIKNQFKTKNTLLLYGVTGSGKTEIYAKMIKKTLQKGKQILFLVPEIALTTQLIDRMRLFFPDKVMAYHSKYNANERLEIWQNILENKEKAQIILGTRSAVFLPFSNLGLIVIDEEHESSYKQQQANPRYHGRDTAIVLANFHKAKVLLGSATPSVESFYNAEKNKYGFVFLKKRFGHSKIPEIKLVDMKEKTKKKNTQGHFSDDLIQEIQNTLKNKQQVILFQNRRGFSPVITCNICNYTPKCLQCDVSLTYHKFGKKMRCHYCNYEEPAPFQCKICSSKNLNTMGLGTQQIEQELQNIFPKTKIGRMDLDTTRGKYAYEKILENFEEGTIEILVGTQMLSKGLDFSNVALVGVLNADTLLHFPDFRAYERTYQMLVQVAGRAGRSHKKGKVLIQSFNPFHQILQQVSHMNYEKMYEEQCRERKEFHYPPFCKIVKIIMKHRNEQILIAAADWFGKSMKNTFGNQVLGVSTPSVAWIKNLHIRNILLKILQGQSLENNKKNILKIKNIFEAIPEFRRVKLSIDVD